MWRENLYALVGQCRTDITPRFGNVRFTRFTTLPAHGTRGLVFR
jgi:hypothetical protein